MAGAPLKRVWSHRPVPVIGGDHGIVAEAQVVRGSTPERLSRAAAAGLLSTDEAETLAGAFKDVYELLLRQEVAAIRDGRSTLQRPAYVNSDVTMVVNLVYPRCRYPMGGVVLSSVPDVMVADHLTADALHRAYFLVSPTKHSFYHSRAD
jgi:hypothetical protein